MTNAPTFRPDPERFDKLYRGEPVFQGGQTPAVVPWDIGQAQPALMELEALGGISGQVLDIGCGLGDNAIFLASRGYSVIGLDGSPAAVERARTRAAEAGVSVDFAVADATDLAGHDGRFDTVIDSALLHCLDADDRAAYAAGVYRATRSGARWHLYCFSDRNVNGVIAPMGAVSESDIRDTLAANGWRIDYLGPTTYLANTAGFPDGDNEPPEAAAQQMPPEAIEHMREMQRRMARITDLLDDNLVHLPFTVVHAHRVD